MVSGTAGWRIRARASWAERFRLAAYLAANPDARITPGEFGEWYCDLPDSRSHAPSLGGLLRKLDSPPGDRDGDAPGGNPPGGGQCGDPDG